MLNKFTSMVVLVTLIWTLTSTNAFAKTESKCGIAQSDGVTEADHLVNEELRAAILKLVAEVKAEGDAVKFPRPQIQPPHRNNLSTGTKIAIGVGIAVAVVAVILITTRCNNEPGAC